MKILLVEDDEGTAEVLKNILIYRHYVVDLAMDGQTGMSLVEAFTYDLILLDPTFRTSKCSTESHIILLRCR
ncbi:hypothetical protein WA1_37255 [Scytonema hofmannii PCC 7110]|uniref:Response regulatory domain-containing protein n=1 Tax=Scytonema hofmannii PCC 7110 TaxID=128403 RepID=A0A139X141_9CYAN|nr:response regulator [Scytonema hofmannii]KYC38427.1 hypothetical protein WA1_37255 [Scytonema hofmannii PCC 7110]